MGWGIGAYTEKRRKGREASMRAARRAEKGRKGREREREREEMSDLCVAEGCPAPFRRRRRRGGGGANVVLCEAIFRQREVKKGREAYYTYRVSPQVSWAGRRGVR